MQLDLATFAFLFSLLMLVWLIYAIKRREDPALPITQSPPFFQGFFLRAQLAKGAKYCFWAACFFLLIAMSHPRAVQRLTSEHDLLKTELPRSGIAIYFLLDESGSMSEKVEAHTGFGERVDIAKIDLAKQAIQEFIESKRSHDLAGLIAFARVADVLCPLTLNRQELMARLKAVQPIKEDARNGTAIGYAIFKAVNIITATKHFAERQESAHKSAYSIQNQAIIIITDGLQSPHPDDKDNPFRFMPPDEAIDYAKENGVRVFYIGIDPILGKSDYANDIAKLKKAMQGTGGELFLADSQHTIDDILSQIDKMEKSELPPEVVVTKAPIREVSLVGLFITLAMLSLALGAFIETTAARSAP